MPRLTRVEAVLGARLDDVSETDFQRLVDESISEAEDLEFKKGVYWQGANKPELAKDVAAFANHVGGLLIVGVDEDGNAHAESLNALQVDDATERSVQETVASYVHPRPTLHTRQVEGTGGRYLMIAVPRSPVAPHAVQNPGTNLLGYPVRTGTSTRWLTETEVADRYRNRFSEAAAAADRAQERSSEVVERLDLSGPWLTLTIVPDIPGQVTIDSANGRRVHAWLGDLAGTGIGGRSVTGGFPRLDYGPQRFILSQRTDATSRSHGMHVEVFVDGGTLIALDVSDTSEESGPYAIAEDWLSHAMVAALSLGAQLSVDIAGASGTAMAVAEIIEPYRVGPRHRERSMILRGAEPALDGQGQRIGFRPYGQLPHTTSPFTVAPSRHVIDLVAIRDSATERIVAAHLLLRDLVQAFGLAEPRLLSSAGELRWAYLPDWPKAWAEANGVGRSNTLVT